MLVRWIYKPPAQRHLVGEIEDVADDLVARELIRTARAVSITDEEAEAWRAAQPIDQAEPGLAEPDAQTSGELVSDAPADVPNDIPAAVPAVDGVDLPVQQPVEGTVAPAVDAPARRKGRSSG